MFSKSMFAAHDVREIIYCYYPQRKRFLEDLLRALPDTSKLKSILEKMDQRSIIGEHILCGLLKILSYSTLHSLRRHEPHLLLPQR